MDEDTKKESSLAVLAVYVLLVALWCVSCGEDGRSKLIN